MFSLLRPPKDAQAKGRKWIWNLEDMSINEDTPHLLGCGVYFKLATSYFRMAFRHTIIGATAFHFRVRNGNGWGHCAMVTRLQTTRLSV